MPESLEGLSEIQKIRQELEDIKAMTGALLHAQASVAPAILKRLNSDEALREAFLLVDGVQSQSQIQVALKARGIKGASVGAISAKFDELANDLNLIVYDRTTKAGRVYRKSTLDGALKISRTLAKKPSTGR